METTIDDGNMTITLPADDYHHGYVCLMLGPQDEGLRFMTADDECAIVTTVPSADLEAFRVAVNDAIDYAIDLAA